MLLSVSKLNGKKKLWKILHVFLDLTPHRLRVKKLNWKILLFSYETDNTCFIWIFRRECICLDLILSLYSISFIFPSLSSFLQWLFLSHTSLLLHALFYPLFLFNELFKLKSENMEFGGSARTYSNFKIIHRTA